MVKIAIVIYSTYGHILTLSKAEVEGAKATGAEVDVYQLPTAEQNDASASASLPVITPSKLAEYDGVLFGIPSRFGTHPYAFKAFLDATGAQWATGAYHGKFIGFFVTSGTQGGGQESVIRNSITIGVHHGFIYVPLGYARAFGEITNLEELHGGSPWGAGSFASGDGTRQPSKIELDIARIQGKSFVETVAKSLGQTLPGSSSGAGAAAAGSGAVAGASAPAAASTAPTSSSAAPAAAAQTKAPTSAVNNAASNAQSTANTAKDNATAAGSSAANAPKKTEENVKSTAQSTAKKEKSGCCSCQ